LSEWKAKYNDLEAEKEKLYQDMKDIHANKEQEIMDLTQINTDLADYIHTLEKKESLNCQGKKVHQLGKKTTSEKTVSSPNESTVCPMVL
jgi:hypothetical protein